MGVVDSGVFEVEGDETVGVEFKVLYLCRYTCFQQLQSKLVVLVRKEVYLSDEERSGRELFENILRGVKRRNERVLEVI